jgi:hypothetical protein
LPSVPAFRTEQSPKYGPEQPPPPPTASAVERVPKFGRHSLDDQALRAQLVIQSAVDKEPPT